MKKITHPLIEASRIREGPYGGRSSDGLAGVFLVNGPAEEMLKIISSGPNPTHWEHVSVSARNRCPTWGEMCFVKGLFWGDDETVIQFHPREDKYINNHPFVLHLWRRDDMEYQLPPDEFI